MHRIGRFDPVLNQLWAGGSTDCASHLQIIEACSSGIGAYCRVNESVEAATKPTLDVGWVVGFLLIGLGALRSRVGTGLEPEDAPLGRLRQVLPYFPLVATALVAGYSGITGRSLGNVGVATLALLVVLVLARQFSALIDVSRLTVELETSMRRTQARIACLRRSSTLDGASQAGLAI